MKSSRKRKTLFEEVQGTTDEIISQVKKLIRKGNARRLMIQNKDGKVVYQIQLTAGVASTAFLAVTSPIVSAISMAALVMNNYKVIIEKYPEDASGKDEYEVEAEVIIDVEDEDDIAAEKAKQSKEETEKTVGKDANEK